MVGFRAQRVSRSAVSGFRGVLFVGGCCLGSLSAGAQTPAGTGGADADAAGGVPVLRADPSELGMKIPDAEPIAGGDRRVLVKTDDDELVVAKLLVEVADRFLVILPDGRLHSTARSDATITERPFVGATVKEVTDKLAKKFPGFKTQSTKHFVYVYNTSPLFYQGTSRILETMYPGLLNYLKSRKMPVSDPPYPLVVVMFRTRQEWSDYMHGIFADSSVAAFYDGISNRVLMYEQSDLGEAAPEYALKQIITTVAHEGVHQILHNVGVQQRLSRWPMWISEGLPEYFAPTSVDKSLRWKGAGTVNDLRMKSIDRMLKSRFRPPGGAPSIAEGLVGAGELDADGYAWSWALTHYLGEKRREPFFRYVAAVSRLGPLEKPQPSLERQLFMEHFGADFSKLSTDMLTHLHKLPYVDPIENMTHYVILFRYTIGASTQVTCGVTMSPREVNRVREQLRQSLPAAVQQTATFDVRNFPTRASALAFARSLR